MSRHDDEVLLLPERFDFDFHAAFNRHCADVLGRAGVSRIVLDFSHVRYIDSAALGLLVLLHRKASPNGIELVARGASGGAREILTIANIQRFYHME